MAAAKEAAAAARVAFVPVLPKARMTAAAMPAFTEVVSIEDFASSVTALASGEAMALTTEPSAALVLEAAAPVEGAPVAEVSEPPPPPPPHAEINAHESKETAAEICV